MNGATERILVAAINALVSGDGAVLDDLLAPDCVLHQCGILEPIQGADTIKQRRFARFLSDPRVDLERVVREGDLVAVHWRTTGLYANPHRPEKVGTPISFPSMAFARLSNGKVHEIWNIQDTSTVSAQLGWEE